MAAGLADSSFCEIGHILLHPALTLTVFPKHRQRVPSFFVRYILVLFGKDLPIWLF